MKERTEEGKRERERETRRLREGEEGKREREREIYIEKKRGKTKK